MLNCKNCEKGRSMVEMMGYMAVVMTVIVAIGKIVTNVFNEHKFSEASIQLGDLAAAISKAGAVEKDYSSVDFKKFVPSAYRVVGNKIFHVFGGEVTIGTVSGDTTKFSVAFKGLRRKQCIEMAMKDWRRNQNVDLYSVCVNGACLYWPVYGYDGGTPKGTLPITRAMVTGTSENDKGLCSLDTNNVVTWTFN
ncbi:MAG: hypothetical protein IJ532_00340 [Alphaproteobacteria bacterium]|nr:hypothetical protein [Alphaproteobacteria bacterium]